MFVRQVYKFLQTPSIEAMVKVATKPVPKAGNDSQITVWGFNEKGEHESYDKGIADTSPYVLRVENYLNLKKKDYVKIKSPMLEESPRKKLPVANIYGTMVDDSSRILAHLQEIFGDIIDSELSDAQRTQGLLIRRLLTGSLYFIILYQGFATVEGRKRFAKELKKDIGLVGTFVAPMVIRSQMDILYGLLDKYPPKEIIEFGVADLRALDTLLGDQKYFLGTTEATIYDTDVFSFVAGLFFDLKLPWFQDIRKELALLEQHCVRMRELLFADSKKHI